MARLAFDKNSLKEELVYLRDPLKLAEHVDGLVKKDGFDKAAELVRMAGKNMPCTVSWNHLIDHEMSKGRVANAVKLYNEVTPGSWFKPGFFKADVYSSDEKACPVAGCSNLHYPLSGLRQASAISTVPGSSSFNIRDHVR